MRLFANAGEVKSIVGKFSSRRWKTNIHTLHDALAKVEQLRGLSYDLKAKWV